MPATSKAQQKLMGAVYGAKKRGSSKGLRGPAKKAYGSLSTKQARDFAKTKHGGLPEKVEEFEDRLHDALFGLIVELKGPSMQEEPRAWLQYYRENPDEIKNASDFLQSQHNKPGVMEKMAALGQAKREARAKLRDQKKARRLDIEKQRGERKKENEVRQLR
jgi:hypothetical protein